jgi:hypothetical protein
LVFLLREFFGLNVEKIRTNSYLARIPLSLSLSLTGERGN